MKKLSLLIFLTLTLVFSAVSHAKGLNRKEQNRLWYVEWNIEKLKIHSPLITKDLIRAIAWLESHWHQYDEQGKTYHCKNEGSKYASWGLMQIYDDPKCRYPGIDYRKIKHSTKYNLKSGLKILEDKALQVSKIRKEYNISKEHSDLEILLRLYNGFKGEQYFYYPENEPRKVIHVSPWGYSDNVLVVLSKKPWKKTK